MIELIQVPTSSPDELSGTYRKSLVILLYTYDNIFSGITHKAVILKSKKLYKNPKSNKRWNLVKKFRQEGCIVKRAALSFDPSLRRHRIQLSLEDILALGCITERELVEELRQVDIKRAKD